MATNLLTPFALGERALVRAPIVDDEQIIANTNEEAVVLEIERDEHVWTVERRRHKPSWSQSNPTWKMKLRRDDGSTFDARTVHTAQGETRKHTFLDVPNIRQRARQSAGDATALLSRRDPPDDVVDPGGGLSSNDAINPQRKGTNYECGALAEKDPRVA